MVGHNKASFGNLLDFGTFIVGGASFDFRIYKGTNQFTIIRLSNRL